MHFCIVFGPKMAPWGTPKSIKIEKSPLGTCFLEAKEGQEVPKKPQEGPKRCPRDPKRPPRDSQDGPKGTQETPKMARKGPERPPRGPKRPQETPKTTPETQKTTQDGSKRPPRPEGTVKPDWNEKFQRIFGPSEPDFQTGLSEPDFALQDSSGQDCNTSKDFGGRFQAWTSPY